jgi:hypothetical protein
MIILLYILAILWVISLFQFARLKISLSDKQSEPLWIHKDWGFLLYMRISGIFILSVIVVIINLI